MTADNEHGETSGVNKKSEKECKLVKNKSKNVFNVEEECKKIGLGDKRKKGYHVVHTVVEEALKSSKNVDEVLEKSVITPDFEKLHNVPVLERTKKSIKSERKVKLLLLLLISDLICFLLIIFLPNFANLNKIK